MNHSELSLSKKSPKFSWKNSSFGLELPLGVENLPCVQYSQYTLIIYFSVRGTSQYKPD